MNIILMLLELLFVIISIYYFFKKNKNIYLLMVVFSILSTILSLKKIELFNIELSLGFILSMGVFIITNILIQKNGFGIIKEILLVEFLSLIFFDSTILLSAILNSSDINYVINVTYNYIFLSNVNIYFANLLAMLIGLFIDGYIYYILRKIKNKIWLSNIISAIIAQFVFVIIYYLIAFLGEISSIELILMIIYSYFIRLLIGIISTVSIYLSTKLK